MSRLIYLGTGLLLAGISLRANALPSAEKWNDIFKIAKGNEAPVDDQLIPIFFGDTDDPNLYYAPYDRVTVFPPAGEPDQRPQFGMAYNEDGGFLSFTVRAEFSKARKDAIQRYQQEGKRIAPLAPIAGGWSLTITDKNSEIFLGAVDTVQTVIPDTPAALSLWISRKAIYQVVTAYTTGASLGVNYNYTFRAVLKPMQIRANINWSSLQSFLQTESRIAVKSEAEGCTYLCLNKGKVSLASQGQIRNVLKRAMEKQVVKIWSRSGGGDMTETERQNRLADELSKIVLAKVFKPMESNWMPVTVPEPKAECSAPGGKFFSFCGASAVNWTWNKEVTIENKEYTYDIVSEGIVNLPAVVGSSFSYMCRDHPDLFINIRTGATGCPMKWEDDDLGIQTDRELGKEPNLPNFDPANPAPVMTGVKKKPPVE
jgi:hypothetical protein